MKRNFVALVASAALLAIAAAATFLVIEHLRDGAGAPSPAAIGGPFSLTDQDGRPVTDADYAGKWKLVFFGFTSCPEVCPTTLNQMALTLKALGPLADEVQPLFITVDPERDTPAVLKSYTEAFDARITGLTGTPEQIAAVAKAYGAFYQKVPQGDDYTMDHSTLIYVMRPDGRFQMVLRHNDVPDDMATRLKALIERG
ncbi:MAG: SCO family protein [Pseudomonadota bacterium]